MTDRSTRFPFLCGVQPFEATVAAVFRAAWFWLLIWRSERRHE